MLYVTLLYHLLLCYVSQYILCSSALPQYVIYMFSLSFTFHVCSYSSILSPFCLQGRRPTLCRGGISVGSYIVLLRLAHTFLSFTFSFYILLYSSVTNALMHYPFHASLIHTKGQHISPILAKQVVSIYVSLLSDMHKLFPLYISHQLFDTLHSYIIYSFDTT
jgi:hypothetical protein